LLLSCVEVGVGLHTYGELAPGEVHVLQQLVEQLCRPLVQLKLQPHLTPDDLKLLPGLFVDVRAAQDRELAPCGRQVYYALQIVDKLCFLVSCNGCACSLHLPWA